MVETGVKKGGAQSSVSKLSRWLPGFSVCAAVLAVFISCAALAGWLLGIPSLARILYRSVAMNPVTAVLLILCGFSLFALRSQPPGRFSRAGKISAVIIVIAAGLKLLSCVFALQFGIDHVQFPYDLDGVHEMPNGIAPNTAVDFLLFGAAMLAIDVETKRGARPAQVLLLSGCFIAMLALIGYSFRVLSLYRVGSAIPMALNTAVAFVLLCLGGLSARPASGVMAVLMSSTAGGGMARRLIPLAIIIPWVLGALLLAGEKANYYETDFGVSLFAVCSILVFTALIWWNARLLYLSDLQRTMVSERFVLQYKATRLLSEASAPGDVLGEILRLTCKTLGWEVGIAHLFDGKSKEAGSVHAWHIESEPIRSFVEAEKQQPPGTASKDGLRFLEDVKQAPNFPGSEAASRAGLRSAILAPVQLDQQSFGLLSFFSLKPQERDENVLALIESLGSQIALCVERRRATQQIRETSANLERSNAELQQFAYQASHDLSEPLRMITSYLQLLEAHLKNGLDPQGQEFIRFAVDGARRMQALIKDLLAYARVDAGSSFGPVDAEAVLQSAVKNLKVAIEETGAVVRHDQLPRVRGDPIQLTQVFQNLIGNGIKFHGPARPEIDVGACRADGEWRFYVRDNGIGIDPKDAQRIFVIFQRLHTRSEYPGTGMGLAMCKKIIERHGGRIWVESTPGNGSKFVFTLPALNGVANS